MFERDENATQAQAGSASAPAVDPAEYLEALIQPLPPFAPDDLQHALNHNQIACKTWLLESLFGALGGRFATVHVLGGWYGLLGALMLSDARFQVDRILSYDLDPNCAQIAEWLNREWVAEGRFRAVTADVCELDYGGSGAAVAAESEGRAPDLVINTSCEHIAPTAVWYDRLPPRMLLVAQSNDYFDCPDHVNCLADIEAFEEELSLDEIYFQGTLKRKRYTRFMLIGRT